MEYLQCPLSVEFVDVREAFLQTLEVKGYSQVTIDQRRFQVGRFLRWATSRKITRIQDVTRNHILEYSTSLIDEGVSPAGQESYLYGVRSFFNSLATRSEIFESPADVIRMSTKERKLPKVISVDEMKRLLHAPDTSTNTGIRDRAILELLYCTGIRRAELLGLQVHDLDLNNGTVRIMGKGAKERLLPLGTHATQWLTRYLKIARPDLLSQTTSDHLWVSNRGGPVLVEALKRLLRKTCEKAGIKPVAPHTLRRSCATHLLSNGANPMVVAELLGHGSLKTLGRYLRVSINELKKTHSRSKLGK